MDEIDRIGRDKSVDSNETALLQDVNLESAAVLMPALARFKAIHGHSPNLGLLLSCASFKGFTSSVKALLAAGVDVNGVNDSRSALHLAAEQGHLAVVAALCAAGADVEARDGKGRTPLDITSKPYPLFPRQREALIRYLRVCMRGALVQSQLVSSTGSCITPSI